jgi:mRNA interferase MazF
MPYDFGDVVLVRFPFTDQTGSKQRPAVIVSRRDYNLARPDVVIMAVTSQIRASAGFAEFLVKDWQAAHLLKPSAIKPVFATIENGLVIKTLGVLSPEDQAALRVVISGIIG